jgi:hypothetical protein
MYAVKIHVMGSLEKEACLDADSLHEVKPQPSILNLIRLSERHVYTDDFAGRQIGPL